MDKVIKILFLAPDPTNVVYRPRLGEEFRAIRERLQAGSHRDSFELVSEWAVRPDDLQQALLKHKPDIVHLSGHGNRKEFLLEDNDGKIKPVSKSALADLFRLFKNQIRIVVLNTCHSQAELSALNETIDYTVAMNAAIRDDSAIEFARAFYRALAFGESVTQSFALALNQLGLSGIPGAEVPQLLVKDGVDTSKPFVDQQVVAYSSNPPDSQSVQPVQLSESQETSGRLDLKSTEAGTAEAPGGSRELQTASHAGRKDEGESAPPVASQSAETSGKSPRKDRSLAVSMSAVALALILAVIGWRLWPGPNIRTLSYWAQLQKYHDGQALGNPLPLTGGVTGETYFSTGDGIRFFFMSPQQGHLYVINEETGPQAPSSRYRIEFPSPAANVGSSDIRAGREVSTSELRFNEETGTERLWIIYTDEAYPALEEAIQLSANKTHQGVIDQSRVVEFVRELLSHSVNSAARVARDDINNRMIVEVSANTLVYGLKLIHQ